MALPPSLLRLCTLSLLLLPTALAQSTSSVDVARPGSDGFYQVTASDLKKLDSSPAVGFPPELSAYELADTVTVAVTISPEGKVQKAKAVGGKNYVLKGVTEKTLKKWAFQPYLVNGAPVPVRSEITFNFENTLDSWCVRNSYTPVRLDEATSRALKLKAVTPQYPASARARGIQGSVELRAVIGEDGRVHALHIISGHPMLAPAAYDAVRLWEFKPYVENGKAQPVDTKVTVNFTLSN